MKRKRDAAGTKPVSQDKLIMKALNLAAQDAVQRHRESGLPLAVWKNDQVVWIHPDEIEPPRNGKSKR